MKKSKLILFILFLPLIFSSCHQEQDNQWPQQNFLKTFEPEPTWINTEYIVKGDAHTGNYADKLDEAHEFSYGLSTRIGDINPIVPYKVVISFWVKFPTNEDISGQAVIRAIDSSDKDKLYFQQSLKDKVTKSGSWEKVTVETTLPNTININDKLAFYIWNKDKKNFLMDDLNIAIQ